MAHKITTVAALSVLVAAAGFPLAVGQDQPSREPTDALREAVMEHRERLLQQRIIADEIRVYDLGHVLGDDPEKMIMSMQALLGSVLIAPVGGDRYAVNARPDEHERFESLLAQLRVDQHEADDDEDADDDRTFTVRLVAAIAPGDDAPSVGERFNASALDVVFAPQIILEGDEGASVSAIESQSYIAGYQPVVSAGAVGYEPQVDEIETGIDMDIEIEDEGDLIEISLSGRISHGEVREQTLRLGEATLPIGLPFIASRSVESEIQLSTAQGPTIVASLPGFEPGSRLIIAVHVTEFARRRAD